MPLYKNVTLYIIFANTLGGVVGVSLIVPSLPVIGKAFDLSPAEIGLIITSYSLPGVLFLLLLGMLADKFGRKAVMIPSLLVFGVAGGSIYWLDDYFWINVMRFVQGIGGAALPSMSTLLIGDLFDEDRRLKVMGLNAAVLSIGTAVFPFIGGLMASVSWNVPFLAFWGALPLALLVAVVLKEPQKRKQQNIGEYFREARQYLLSVRSVMVLAIGTMVFILLYGGVLTYLTLYMDQRFAMSTFQVGLYISVGSFATAGLAALGHRFEKSIGRRWMLVGGFILFATSFFSILAVEVNVWLLGSILVFGGAMGMTVPLLQSIITEIPPIEYRGLLVSMLGMVIRLGQTVGPPLLATMLYFGDLRLVFWACGVLSLLFVALLFFFGSALVRK